MSAKVISFVSAKGGTGKTVISASFAQFLGALNKKGLLIDTDADTNGLTIFYLSGMISARKIMADKNIFATGIFESDKDRLPTPFKLDKHVDIIPAAYVMEQTASVDEKKFKRALRQTLKVLGKEYDYVFLDAQAGSDTFAEITIALADEVIIVSEYDPVSLAGWPLRRL